MPPKRIRELRRWCQQLVADLGLVPPFTLDELVTRLSVSRGRPIRVMAHLVQGVKGIPCGVWVPLPNEDVVFVERNTSSCHQSHICLHELAHIICGHNSSAVMGPDYLNRLLPELDPSVVASVLAHGRTRYDSDDEHEAETMATLLGELVEPERGAGTAVVHNQAETTRVLGDLAKTLGL